MEIEPRTSSPPALLADPDDDDGSLANEPSLSGGWEAMTLPADDAWEALLDPGERSASVRVCDCALPWNRCSKCNCYEAQTRRRLLSLIVGQGRSGITRSRSPPLPPVSRWDSELPARPDEAAAPPVVPFPVTPVQLGPASQEQQQQQQQQEEGESSPPQQSPLLQTPTPINSHDQHHRYQYQDQQQQRQQQHQQQGQWQQQQQQSHPRQPHPSHPHPQAVPFPTLHPTPQQLQQMQQYWAAAFNGSHQFLQTWPLWAQEMWRQWAALAAAQQVPSQVSVAGRQLPVLPVPGHQQPPSPSERGKLPSHTAVTADPLQAVPTDSQPGTPPVAEGEGEERG
eukprot:Hpha_TRINITY_DN15644_c1_g2::TRINITY_DN15644_c1_g2_i1::g.97589::m.97589